MQDSIRPSHANSPRYLGQTLLGVLQGHIDAGRGGVGGQQATVQQRLTQRQRGFLAERGLREFGAVAYQVTDREVVAVRPAVLKVGNRVDANGVRNLPGLMRDPLDRAGDFGREYLASTRFHDEHDVVVLRIGVLELLEGLQLRIRRAEEHAVVVRELEVLGAETGSGYEQHGGKDRKPGATRHGLAYPERESFQARRLYIIHVSLLIQNDCSG